MTLEGNPHARRGGGSQSPDQHGAAACERTARPVATVARCHAAHQGSTWPAPLAVRKLKAPPDQRRSQAALGCQVRQVRVAVVRRGQADQSRRQAAAGQCERKERRLHASQSGPAGPIGSALRRSRGRPPLNRGVRLQIIPVIGLHHVPRIDARLQSPPVRIALRGACLAAVRERPREPRLPCSPPCRTCRKLIRTPVPRPRCHAIRPARNCLSRSDSAASRLAATRFRRSVNSRTPGSAALNPLRLDVPRV
jgi:hypothetical protein